MQIIDISEQAARKFLPKSKYPLGEWMDGSVHELVRGEHFAEDLSTKSFRSYLHEVAPRVGLRAQTASPDQARVTVQFYYPAERR